MARKVMDQYCVTCHNTRTSTGGLSLEGLDPAAALKLAGDGRFAYVSVRGADAIVVLSLEDLRTLLADNTDLVSGLFGGMPMCHGAGGLTAWRRPPGSAWRSTSRNPGEPR